MDNYKINYIFEKEQDINNIFINVLNKELKKYILMNLKNERKESCMQFSHKGSKRCYDEFK